MKLITPTKEENKILKQLDPKYYSYSEMSMREIEFLNSIILRYKPKRCLELGVASGSSSVVILNAIKDSSSAELISFDYSDNYYRDESKKTGFLVDSYPNLKQKWRRYTGGLISEHIEKIDVEGVDLCFIDTMHIVPGEILDFILVLPYLNKDAVVVLHDTNLQTKECNFIAYSNNILISSITGEKLILQNDEKTSFHQIEKRETYIPFANIAGVKLDGSQKERVWDIFNLLTLKWRYIPRDKDISSAKKLIAKNYSSFYSRMFDEIYDFQISAAKMSKDVIDYRILDKKEKILSCIEKGLFLKQFPKSVILYGAGSLAKALIPKIKDTTQIDFIIDNNVEGKFENIPVKTLRGIQSKDLEKVVVVTVFQCFEEIKRELSDKFNSVDVINIEEFLEK